MKLRSIIIAIVLLGAGAAGAKSLVDTAPEPERLEVEARVTTVDVTLGVKASKHLTVRGMGTVTPAREIDVFSEVAGRVTAIYDGLVEGGRVVKGTRLVRVDARDYKYQVDTARASLAQARARLEEERKRNEVAQRDWELLQKRKGEAQDKPTDLPQLPGETPTTGEDEEPTFGPNDMLRRVPQLQSAEANLRSVKSQLEQAKLQVGRTRIVAPFDAVVTQTDVEVGEIVGAATPLAKLVGTDMFYVNVAVPIDTLATIRIPGTNSSEERGAAAKIVQTVGKTTIERDWFVVRALPTLREEGRMAQLMVAVSDPFQLALAPEERDIPLMLGSYVRVEIEGHDLPDMIELPRSALREDDTVWIANADDQLEIRAVEVGWLDRDSVFIRKGVTLDDRVITSRIAVPLADMRLRVLEPAEVDRG